MRGDRQRQEEKRQKTETWKSQKNTETYTGERKWGRSE
jgi:hypothetical protein